MWRGNVVSYGLMPMNKFVIRQILKITFGTITVIISAKNHHEMLKLWRMYDDK